MRDRLENTEIAMLEHPQANGRPVHYVRVSTGKEFGCITLEPALMEDVEDADRAFRAQPCDREAAFDRVRKLTVLVVISIHGLVPIAVHMLE